MKKILCVDSYQSANEVTIGNIYYVIDEDLNYYYIKNNFGEVTFFNKDRFIDVKENEYEIDLI